MRSWPVKHACAAILGAGRTSAIALVGIVGGGHAATAQDIVASSKPAHTLVAMVVGNTGNARVLIDGTASPHTYQMRPSDAKAVGSAAVFVRISEGLEPFTGRLAKSLPKGARMVTLAAAPGLATYPKRTGATFEVAKHGGHGHSHGHKHSAEKDDPHIWLDPANAKVLLSYLAAELGQVSPANAASYKANAEAAAKRIDALHADLVRELALVAGKPFVVFHDSLQYLERRYGLTAAGSVVMSPEVQPGAKRLTELRGKVIKLGAVCVFAEPQFESKLVASVTHGSAARAGMLDPEGTQLKPGPGFYDELMRKLAADLRSCLAAT